MRALADRTETAILGVRMGDAFALAAPYVLGRAVLLGIGACSTIWPPPAIPSDSAAP